VPCWTPRWPDRRGAGAEQLAQAQNIPGKFLETILTHLRKSGLVRSQRDPDGALCTMPG
jgi:DNA-binding IscR family transcriptional regulator